MVEIKNKVHAPSLVSGVRSADSFPIRHNLLTRLLFVYKRDLLTKLMRAFTTCQSKICLYEWLKISVEVSKPQYKDET